MKNNHFESKSIDPQTYWRFPFIDHWIVIRNEFSDFSRKKKIESISIRSNPEQTPIRRQ